eukprot:PhM_4_TR5237/c0_g1_i1/m.774
MHGLDLGAELINRHLRLLMGLANLLDVAGPLLLRGILKLELASVEVAAHLLLLRELLGEVAVATGLVLLDDAAHLFHVTRTQIGHDLLPVLLHLRLEGVKLALLLGLERGVRGGSRALQRCLLLCELEVHVVDNILRRLHRLRTLLLHLLDLGVSTDDSILLLLAQRLALGHELLDGSLLLLVVLLRKVLLKLRDLLHGLAQRLHLVHLRRFDGVTLDGHELLSLVAEHLQDLGLACLGGVVVEPAAVVVLIVAYRLVLLLVFLELAQEVLLERELRLALLLQHRYGLLAQVVLDLLDRVRVLVEDSEGLAHDVRLEGRLALFELTRALYPLTLEVLHVARQLREGRLLHAAYNGLVLRHDLDRAGNDIALLAPARRFRHQLRRSRLDQLALFRVEAALRLLQLLLEVAHLKLQPTVVLAHAAKLLRLALLLLRRRRARARDRRLRTSALPREFLPERGLTLLGREALLKQLALGVREHLSTALFRLAQRC